MNRKLVMKDKRKYHKQIFIEVTNQFIAITLKPGPVRLVLVGLWQGDRWAARQTERQDR